MDFNLKEEQRAIQDSLQRWLDRHYTFEARKAIARSDTGASDDAWAAFAELGLLALPLPEDAGGLGGNGIDTMLVMERFGASLVLEPYLPTVVVCGTLIDRLGAQAQRETWLGRIAAGQAKLAFAHQELGARHARLHVATRASAVAGGYRLDGTKVVVVGAPQADRLLVSARLSGADGDADGLSVFLVDPGAAGVTLRSYANHDGQRAADVRLDGVQVGKDALLGAAGAAAPAIELALDRAIAALCAEAAGIMRTMIAGTLEYLKTRKQFGVALGTFQALQHRMADMVVASELAGAMALLACGKVDSPDPAERSRTMAAAKAYIGRQARMVGQQSIQLHGGMGLTEEMFVSHLFKRLTLIDATCGDSDFHLGRFGGTLLVA